MKTTERFKKDEGLIINRRIKKKKDDITQLRERMKDERLELNGLGLSPLAWNAYNHIKNVELSRKWNHGNQDKMKKLDWIQKKTNKINRGTEPSNEIPTSDADLNNMYGDLKIVPIVLGGIQCSDAVKEFLKLPAKFRVYSKLSKAKLEVKVETTAVKQRWGARDAEDILLGYRDKSEVIEEHVKNLKKTKELEKETRKPVKGCNVNFTNLRANDLKHNSKMVLPDPSSNRDEVIIQNQKLLMIDLVNEYINNNCDDDLLPIGANNLTWMERKGMKEIKDRCKTKGWMLYETDKSGRMVLDTETNFMKCMESHIKHDFDATLEDVRISETHLNNISRLLVRGLDIGGTTSQSDKCRNALLSQFARVLRW